MLFQRCLRCRWSLCANAFLICCRLVIVGSPFDHVVPPDISCRVARMAMAWNSDGAASGWSAVLSFRARQTFRAGATRTDARDVGRGACSFSRAQRSLCFDGRVRLGLAAYLWVLTPIACVMLIG